MTPRRRGATAELGRALWKKYQRDEAMDAAGALTFYAFLALFPFLLFVATLATRRLTPELMAGLLAELARVAPGPVTELVAGHLRGIQQGTGTGILVFTLAGALWSSVTAVAALISALNKAYEVEEQRSFWRVHGLALLTTLVLGALVLAAAMLTIAWPIAANALARPIRETLGWMRVPLAGVLEIVVLAVCYRFLPALGSRRRRIVPGAALAVALWLAATWGFSAYVSRVARYELVYGTLGGVAVLLLWMWITGQAVLVGAELNRLLGGPGPRGRA